MTELYTEALKDAEKLREIAEQDAKNRIVEKLTPYIKRIIAKEASGASDFFFEQEEDEDLQQPEQSVADEQPVASADPQGMGGEQPTTEPAGVADPAQTLSPELEDQENLETAPVESPEGEELVNASMPDEDGKIVVDFEDLFVDADADQATITPKVQEPEGSAPIEAEGEEELENNLPAEEGDEEVAQAVPSPEETPVEDQEEEVPPVSTESINYKEFNRVLSNITERVDRAYFSRRVSDISKGSIKQRLFDLLEALDAMHNRGLINNKQARLNENKLEFLFLKLKEAGLHNSYSMKEQDKGKDMTSLKEFAAKLFEEDESLGNDSVESGETGLKTDDEYSKHAADVSGVDPELGEPEDIKVSHEGEKLSEEAVCGDVEEELPWDEGEAVVDEEDQDMTVTKSMNENNADADPDQNDDVAEGAAGFGDTKEEPVAEFEVDDAELAEAVRSIRKENIKRKLEALREASDGKEEDSWEDGEPEDGEDPSHEKLKKEGMYEMDMEPELEVEDDLEGADEEDGDLVLSVDLPPEVEEELAALGVDDLDVDVDLNLDVDLEDDEEDEDDELELVDDEGEESDDDDDELDGFDDDDEAESSEEDVVLADDADEVKMESRRVRHLQRKIKLLEKRLTKTVKALRQKNNSAKNYKEQLAETNLFTSKAVLYSKFLQRALTEKSLSKKALNQIVEHLDRGKSVAETKAIYNKIRRKLDEHASASRKLGGSSSKMTKPGSANLNESNMSHTGNDSNGQTVQRWQQLAGLVKDD